MTSVIVATRSLRFNSMRWSNLGKSAALVLETLSDGPLSRKQLEERLGYSPGGANGILKKLKEAGLVRSDNGVYSLTDDFEERIQPFLEANKADIEYMKDVHEGDREDYALRLEAWRRADEDEAEIQKTAMESRGVYLLRTMMPEAIYNRRRMLMEHHYRGLKFGHGTREHEDLKESRDSA